MQTSTLQMILNSQFSKSQDLSTAKDNLNFKKIFQIANGIGANKAESIFHDQRTLGVSANEDIDLNGVLTDAFGAVIPFTKIKTLIVFGSELNTNNVIVGGAATNQFINWVGAVTDTIIIKPGGILMLHDPSAGGYAVTPATGDLLRMENSAGGTSVTYDLIVIGETT